MDVEVNYAFYYIESNLFCILVYAVLLYKTITAVDRQRTQVLFGYVLISHMLYFLTDVFWVLVDSGTLPKTVELIYASNVINYIASSVIGYVTFLYTQLYQGIEWFDSGRNRLLAAIPAIANIAMIALTPLTGLYFWVDETPELVDGPLYYVMLAVTFAYLIVAAIRAFYLARRPENYATREIHRTIAFFPVVPIIAGVIQAFNWRVPWICYGLTIAMLFMYITFSDNLISQDSLTGLNNRNELNRHLAHRVKNLQPGLDLYLLILDADYFKRINDTYGHNEGDRALVLLADGLRAACADRRHHEFISRYGGDEFIICVEAESEREVLDIIADVRESVSEAGRASGRPYELSVTVGHAKFASGTATGTIPGLIGAADRDLYTQKRARS